jgi:hypothetical protein
MPDLNLTELKGLADLKLPRSSPARHVAQVDAILASIARGSSRTHAAAASGMGKTKFFNLLRDDPAFAAAVEEAEGQMVRSVSGRLYDIAMTAPPQTGFLAAATLLERRVPSDWGRQQRVVHDVHIDGGIDVRQILADPRLIDLYSEAERLTQGELAVLPPHEENEE